MSAPTTSIRQAIVEVLHHCKRPETQGADSWGNLPDKNRAGAEMWITGSYDPTLNLTYWGTAQAKPWMPLTRGTDGDALYSSSTIALNPDDGKLKWYFQHAPAEALDLDIVFERVLVDSGGQNWRLRSARTVSCGNSIVRPANISATPSNFSKHLTKFDPKTGRPTYREDIIKETPRQNL
jgi:alcohol dehydrogenase (cytochrome c)